MGAARPRRRGGLFWVLLWRAMTVRRASVLTAVAAIAVGAAIISALASLYLDISSKMSRELRAYGGNFLIGPSEVTGERSIGRAAYAQVLQRIPPERLAGASPYLYGIVKLEQRSVVLVGVDFPGLRKLSPYWQITGDWIALGFDTRYAMVGRRLADARGLAVGDVITLADREGARRLALKLRGIMDTGSAADEQVFVNLAVAERLLGTQGQFNHALLSVVVDGLDVEALATRLSAADPTVAARPITMISRSEGQVIHKIKTLMAVMAGVILIITTLCVNATLSGLIVERSAEIGLQKALGADSRDIVMQFLTEALLMALAGATCGLVLGFGVAQVLGYAVFRVSVHVPGPVALLALVASILAALAAAAIPIRGALRVPPAHALKGE